MAKKKSQLDRAIEALEAERAVLDMAITRLKQQRDQAPARKARTKAKPAVDDVMAAQLATR